MKAMQHLQKQSSTSTTSNESARKVVRRSNKPGVTLSSSYIEFVARTCFALWQGSFMPNCTPFELYSGASKPFIQLVKRTLHPHLMPQVGLVALLYVHRYLVCQRKNLIFSQISDPLSPQEVTQQTIPAPGSEARVWCTALSLAIKETDDRAACSRLWKPACVDERAGGMSAVELGIMELEFLKGVEWKLKVLPEQFEDWMNCLSNFRNYVLMMKKRESVILLEQHSMVKQSEMLKTR